MGYQTWIKRIRRHVFTALFIGLAISGCGGGGGDEDGGIIGTGYILRGTVASERALARNEVEVKSSSGETTMASIGSNGRFETNTVVGESPFLLRVDLGNNEFQYSIGHLDGNTITQNVHSYTDATVRNWFAQQGQNVDAQFSANGSSVQLPGSEQYGAIFDSLTGIVALVREDYGIGNVDLADASFDADNTGVDLYLNQNPVIINNSLITIIINDPASGTQSFASSNVSLSSDLEALDTSAPTTPDGVRVLPSGNDELVVVWEPSTDEIGVSGYMIFRDGILIDTTAFPVYSDSGLAGNTEFSYSIVAFDSAGNESSASVVQVGSTSEAIDTTPPPAPVSLATSATTQSVQLTWSQSSINDVARFEVRRSSTGGTPQPYLNVTSTFLTDVNVEAGTQYCYQVLAIDSVENSSEPSEIQCVTTTGALVVTLPSSEGVNIALPSTSFQVAENASSVTIAVTRTGTTAASVDYTTIDGTAISGEDYTAASGTLTWAAGDMSPQNISVQISADDQVEGNEDFRVALSNSSGGNIITGESTVTIIDMLSDDCSSEFPETSIDTEMSIAPGCYTVDRTITIRSGGNLTLAPDTTLKFESGTGINTNTGGSLTANGTASQPILFTGVEQTEGFWRGLLFSFSNSSRNSLDHATVEYGGSSGDANIDISSSSTSSTRISITNSTIRHSSGYGVVIDDDSFIDEFSGNTITLNNMPVRIESDAVSSLSADNVYTGNTEDAVLVDASSINQSATWDTLDVPYVIDSPLTVNETLTLSRGTTMIFEAGARLSVNADGALIAVGSQAEPILLTGAEQTPGFWGGLRYFFSSSPQNRLEHVVIEYGGSATNNDANLNADSTTSSPSRISVSNVVLRNSLDYGFSFDSGTLVSAFENITITANNRPGTLPPEIVGSFGEGLSISGNTNDALSIQRDTLQQPTRWPDLGVPYLIDNLTLSSNLTLDPGVEVIASSGSTINVTSSGSLTARGTASSPITFTGEQPVNGFWDGITFTFSNSVENILDNVTVNYGGGGGTPTSSANIDLNCTSSSPTRLTLTNSSLNNSAGWGLLDDDDCITNTTNLTLRNQVIKVATLAILFGLLLAGYSLWQMFEKRNVASEPEVMNLAELQNPEDGLVYATINGGTLDLQNTFEYSIKKRRRAARVQNYFIPVKDAGSDSVKYVLQTKTDPGSLDLSNSNFTGLLQKSSAMPDKLSEAYATAYPGQSFALLDTSYKPQTTLQNLTKVGLFLGLAVVGFFVRLLMTHRPTPQPTMN